MMTIKLTTIGRRSGLAREVDLYAYPDGDCLVIVGSSAGSARDPGWALNLRSDPRAAVRRGKHTQEMTAREAEGPERDRLWKLVTSAFSLYVTYQGRTDRTLPIFVLSAAETAR